MNKVKLFDEEIVLNKIVYIMLDFDDVSLKSLGIFFDEAFCPNSVFTRSVTIKNDTYGNECRHLEIKKYPMARTYFDLCRMLKQGAGIIYTPLTHCLCASIMEKGYELIVVCKGKCIKFSELLNGKEDGSFGRQIRETQNWEKMLYSGCFDLEIPDWRGK